VWQVDWEVVDPSRGLEPISTGSVQHRLKLQALADAAKAIAEETEGMNPLEPQAYAPPLLLMAWIVWNPSPSSSSPERPSKASLYRKMIG
jgi:hypothetical protein